MTVRGPSRHLKLGISASGMPLSFRMSHCVLPAPFLATALLFFPENLVGSVGSGAPSPCGACSQQSTFWCSKQIGDAARADR